VDLHHDSGADGILELVKDIAIVLPAIYIAFSILRLALIALAVRLSPFLGAADTRITWQVGVRVLVLAAQCARAFWHAHVTCNRHT